MPPRIPLETVLLGAGVAALALLARPSPMDEGPADVAPMDDLASPTWPLPDAGFGPVIAPPFPGGHTEYDNQVLYVCQLYGMTDPLAPLLFKATIQVESGWNVRSRGDAGACGPYRGDSYYTGYCSIGLMQVHRPSHPDLASAYDLRDPDQNILAGGQVLAGAYRYWPDVERVRAAYQGGEGGAHAWPTLAGWNPTHAAALRSGVAAVTSYFRQYAAAVGVAV